MNVSTAVWGGLRGKGDAQTVATPPPPPQTDCVVKADTIGCSANATRGHGTNAAGWGPEAGKSRCGYSSKPSSAPTQQGGRAWEEGTMA